MSHTRQAEVESIGTNSMSEEQAKRLRDAYEGAPRPEFHDMDQTYVTQLVIAYRLLADKYCRDLKGLGYRYGEAAFIKNSASIALHANNNHLPGVLHFAAELPFMYESLLNAQPYEKHGYKTANAALLPKDAPAAPPLAAKGTMDSTASMMMMGADRRALSVSSGISLQAVPGAGAGGAAAEQSSNDNPRNRNISTISGVSLQVMPGTGAGGAAAEQSSNDIPRNRNISTISGIPLQAVPGAGAGAAAEQSSNDNPRDRTNSNISTISAITVSGISLQRRGTSRGYTAGGAALQSSGASLRRI